MPIKYNLKMNRVRLRNSKHKVVTPFSGAKEGKLSKVKVCCNLTFSIGQLSPLVQLCWSII